MNTLIRLLTTQPQLLLDHVEAYSDLVSQEIAAASSAYRRYLLYVVLALLLATLSLVLAGVALMLWATQPAAQIQTAWVLVVVPLVPCVLALWCGRVAKNDIRNGTFAELRGQLKADLAMFSSMKSGVSPPLS